MTHATPAAGTPIATAVDALIRERDEARAAVILAEAETDVSDVECARLRRDLHEERSRSADYLNTVKQVRDNNGRLRAELAAALARLEEATRILKMVRASLTDRERALSDETILVQVSVWIAEGAKP